MKLFQESGIQMSDRSTIKRLDINEHTNAHTFTHQKRRKKLQEAV